VAGQAVGATIKEDMQRRRDKSFASGSREPFLDTNPSTAQKAQQRLHLIYFIDVRRCAQGFNGEKTYEIFHGGR
jgi:hypothetical protein